MIHAKMAEDVCEGIVNDLNLIVSTAERCGNMKKVETDHLRNRKYTKRLYVHVKTSRDSKSQKNKRPRGARGFNEG